MDKYRKAIAAGVGAAVATIPVTALIAGTMTDYRAVLAVAVNAAIAAIVTYLAPANAS